MMDCYTDWKPVPICNGTCLHCGLTFYTKIEILKKGKLREAQEMYVENMKGYEDNDGNEISMQSFSKLTAEEKEGCRQFDKAWYLV